jgi:hypothetical protein
VPRASRPTKSTLRETARTLARGVPDRTGTSRPVAGALWLQAVKTARCWDVMPPCGPRGSSGWSKTSTNGDGHWRVAQYPPDGKPGDVPRLADPTQPSRPGRQRRPGREAQMWLTRFDEQRLAAEIPPCRAPQWIVPPRTALAQRQSSTLIDWILRVQDHGGTRQNHQHDREPERAEIGLEYSGCLHTEQFLSQGPAMQVINCRSEGYGGSLSEQRLPVGAEIVALLNTPPVLSPPAPRQVIIT